MNEKNRLNLNETILKKIFKIFDPTMINREYINKDLIIYAIEYFLIEINSQSFFISSGKLLQGEIVGFEEDALLTNKYLDEAREIYTEIESDLKKYFAVKTNIEKYRDNNFDKKYMEEIILNTVTIAKFEINKLLVSENLKNEIRDMIDYFWGIVSQFDSHINRKSNLLSFIDIIRKSKLNFVDISEDGKHFYPILIDFFLDYTRIAGTYEANEKEIKQHTNNFNYLEKRIQNKRTTFGKYDFFIVYFFKKTRKDQIYKYILAYYLQRENNDFVISLFKKVFNINKNNRAITKVSMEEYDTFMLQSDLIVMSKYSKYFL